MRSLYVGAFLLTFFDNTHQWTYEDEASWPGQCTIGKKQSPVDIVSKEAQLLYQKGDLKFHGYAAVNVSGVNNGHTIQFNKVEGAPQGVSISGGPLQAEYEFLQLHFHWLSEHAIDNTKYPLEIHLVHRKVGLSMEESLNSSDGISVIAVMCQVLNKANSNYPLKELIRVVPDLLQPTAPATEPFVADLRRLLSPNPQSYYTYSGSLTTPDCNEAVKWIVMDQPVIISDKHYKLLKKANVGGVDNYRSLQPLNHRLIFRSCASIKAPSFLGFLVTFFQCSAGFSSVVKRAACVVGNLKTKITGDKISEQC